MAEPTLESLQFQHDQLEQVVITLMNGYAELAVLVEALTSQTLAPMADEDKSTFLLQVQQARKEMFGLMRKAARDVAGADYEPPSTVADVDTSERITLGGSEPGSDSEPSP